jgi:hypothetical protein
MEGGEGGEAPLIIFLSNYAGGCNDTVAPCLGASINLPINNCTINTLS